MSLSEHVSRPNLVWLCGIARRRQSMYYVEDAALSQVGRRDAAVHFDTTYQILQRHRAVSLPQHTFLIGLCLQTAANYLSKSDKY